MTYWFIFIEGNILLNRHQEKGGYSIPWSTEPPVTPDEHTEIFELPKIENCMCKAFSTHQTPQDKSGFAMMGLRESYEYLPKIHYNIAGKASELLYWDKQTKFCGYCGAPTLRNSTISKRCTNCGKEFWPQVSPAIIVRIKRKNEGGKESILLVHAKNFRRNFYGLVAGFVETGETLEECVRREVMEETGLTIENIKYFTSQPWPFPSGIMIGFTADYVSGLIHLQEEELSYGGWFTLDNLPTLPDKLSIARQLIDDWMEHCEQGNNL